jgi:hypothetical protein
MAGYKIVLIWDGEDLGVAHLNAPETLAEQTDITFMAFELKEVNSNQFQANPIEFKVEFPNGSSFDDPPGAIQDTKPHPVIRPGSFKFDCFVKVNGQFQELGKGDQQRPPHPPGSG